MSEADATPRATPRKSAPKTRGKPFARGNPGKPKGARHRATLAAEALLDGEAEKLTRKAIDLAIAGDTVALRLCLERLVPPRRERPIIVDLPAIADVRDHPAALAAVMSSVARGELTPAEAQAFAGIMEQHRKAVETSEIIQRIEALEKEQQP